MIPPIDYDWYNWTHPRMRQWLKDGSVYEKVYDSAANRGTPYLNPDKDRSLRGKKRRKARKNG